MNNAAQAVTVLPEIKFTEAQHDAMERLFAGKPLSDGEWRTLAPITDAMGFHRAKGGFMGLLGEVTGINDIRRLFKVKGANNKVGGALSGALKMGGIGYGGYIGGKWIYNKITK